MQENREGGRVRGQDIQVLLKEQFSVDHALPSVYHVLERCELSWISTRSKHPKSDPAMQEEFKKKIQEKVIEIVPQGIHPENIEILFQDEARVGHRGTVTRIWAR